MPIYCYEITEGECKVCGGAFELMRPLSRPELTACPLCKKAVRKVIQPIHTPKLLKPIGPAEARNAGFKVYEKRSDGNYEAV